jgi:hypothetical protein
MNPQGLPTVYDLAPAGGAAAAKLLCIQTLWSSLSLSSEDSLDASLPDHYISRCFVDKALDGFLCCAAGHG